MNKVPPTGSKAGVPDGASQKPDPAEQDKVTPPVDKVEDPPPEADFA